MRSNVVAIAEFLMGFPEFMNECSPRSQEIYLLRCSRKNRTYPRSASRRMADPNAQITAISRIVDQLMTVTAIDVPMQAAPGLVTCRLSLGPILLALRFVLGHVLP